MKKLAVLSLALGLAATFTAVAFAQDEPVNVVKGTAVLDGNISEFTKAGAQPIVLKGAEMLKDAQTLDNDADLNGTVYLMYDDKYVYMGAEVTDESITFNKSGGDVWNQDCVELWIDGYQYGVSVDADGNNYISDWKGSNVAGENLFKATAKGYVMEARFPVADLAAAEVATKKGGKFQVAVGIDDADNDGSREAQLYFPTSWVHSTPDTFATATLK